ncbi:MAG TPA: ATP-binding protein, partial [Pseudonocardia sp.]|nr:ATP-binding protein [Pseudonocardia sp.]
LNVEKHADAGTVVVSLGSFDGGVQVAVADDGVPRAGQVAPDGRASGDGDADGTGLGLRMLVEKAARLGGRVSLVNDEDGGTTLRVVLPGQGEPR